MRYCAVLFISVCRYMENGSLASVLDKFGPLPETLVIGYVNQVILISKSQMANASSYLLDFNIFTTTTYSIEISDTNNPFMNIS